MNKSNMDQCDLVEMSLLERIQSELEADPDLYDVTFSVGLQKTKVKALKIILLAASPVFKHEFKTKRDNAVLRDGDGILLPEFDGDSFKLFVKLTSLDTWSVEVLQKLNLSINQLLDLLSICRRYEMRTALKSLRKLTATFIQSFHKFKDTAAFLKLSQANLKEVFASDDLPIGEMEVFKCGLKWAESKCTEQKIGTSVNHLRDVLRDCLYEIRFPTMSNVDFTNAMEVKELLSSEETLKIYKYIGLNDCKRQHIAVQSLGFNAKRRNSVLPAKQVSNSGESQPQLRSKPGAEAAAQAFKVKPSYSVQPKGTPNAKSPGSSTLSLLNGFRKIDDKIPFVCDERLGSHLFNPKQKVAVVGLGFAGPIDADAFYDVAVDIQDGGSDDSFTGGTIRKSIFALKGQTFYFLFDKPITVRKTQWGHIMYSLKGPNTPSITGGQAELTVQQEGTNKFGFWFKSNQLSEILFNRQ